MSVTTYEYNTDIVLPLRIAQNLKFCKLCHWIYPLYQQIKCSLLLWLCYQVFYVLVIQTKKTKSFKKPNILESLVSDALKHILLNNFLVIRPLTQRLPHSIIPASDISGSPGHLIIVLEFRISRPGSQSDSLVCLANSEIIEHLFAFVRNTVREGLTIITHFFKIL